MELIADIFSQAVESTQNNQNLPDIVAEKYQTVVNSFSAIWVADASTLEALKRKANVFKQQKQQLAGKIMMIVQMFSHHPIKLWYSQNPRDNERKWSQQLIDQLPVNGLLVFDMGFFKFPRE